MAESTTSAAGAAPAPASASAAPPAPASASTSSSSDSVLIAKLSAKVKKLTEDNGKYKNLLKLAKERIQQQEDELDGLRHKNEQLQSQQKQSQSLAEQPQLLQVSNHSAQQQSEDPAAAASSLDDALAGHGGEDGTIHIVRVCQRVKVPMSINQNNNNNGTSNNNNGNDEIWALLELEHGSDDSRQRRHKEWKRFDTEAQLQDFIQRDSTGREPLSLPPFSLTPEQSEQLARSAKLERAALTEEYRRFRVKAELSRKQAEAHIRDLQNAQTQTAALRIEGSPQDDSGGGNSGEFVLANHTNAAPNGGMASPRASIHSATAENGNHEAQQLRAELAAQEAYWKEAYDTLLAENTALQSSGSEALLASQWRARYEQARQEKDELVLQIQQQKQAQEDGVSGVSYEEKYRDLKESFRLYRKKAKEIFDTSPYAAGAGAGAVDPALLTAMQEGSADAKLNYLRNLMVNYLMAEPTVQNHMEGAIGTLLQFSPDDCARIEKKRQEVADSENWFY